MAHDLVGTVVDEVAFDVERGKIAEFARATFVADAVHTDRAAAEAAGFSDVPATPTHVVVAGHYRDQQAFVARLGLELARVVVGSVRWEYRRPLVAGDELRGARTVVADDMREGRRGGRMRLVTLRTEYRDARDEVVVLQEEVLIERAKDR